MSVADHDRWNHIMAATGGELVRRNQEDLTFKTALRRAESENTYFTLERGTQLLGERVRNLQEQHRRHFLLLIGIFGVGKTFLSRALHAGAESAGLKSQLWHDDRRAVHLFQQLKRGNDPTQHHALAIVGHWNAAKLMRKYVPIINRREYTVVSLIADQQTRHNNAVAHGRPGFTDGQVIKDAREISWHSIHAFSNFIDDDADIILDVSEECRITHEEISEQFCQGILKVPTAEK